MKNETAQIKRIRRHEALFDEALAATAALDEAARAFENARPALEALRAYYGGSLWKKDFAADEKGLLPADLKRGVLSEDGLYDLLDAADRWEAALDGTE